MQAITLEMAAAQIWGEKNYDKLDRLTVSMKHPDAAAALLSGGSIITAHFTVPPFSTEELESPKIHKVTDSYEIYGGPATINVVYATQKFHDENQKIYHAYLAALTEATRLAQTDRKKAAKVFLIETKAKMTPEFVEKVLDDPQIHYTIVPSGTEKLARFMHKVGIIKTAPATWKDMFFPEVWNQPGS